ncbi:MAG: hypothetical protein LBS77_02565, partial [Desulfovibrio sp.]|nr:hypothetical protein [Desulfovibrio sp.]
MTAKSPVIFYIIYYECRQDPVRHSLERQVCFSPNKRKTEGGRKPIEPRKKVEPVIADEKNLCADAGDAGKEPKRVDTAAGSHIRPRGEDKHEKTINPLFRLHRLCWCKQADDQWQPEWEKYIRQHTGHFNLTTGMLNRRHTRKTMAFSKKIENLN